MKEKMKYLNWLIKEIMASFGGGIVTLALMSYLLGDGVAQFSPVFGLGKRGIPLEIVAQFLLLAAFSVIPGRVPYEPPVQMVPGRRRQGLDFLRCILRGGYDYHDNNDQDQGDIGEQQTTGSAGRIQEKEKRRITRQRSRGSAAPSIHNLRSLLPKCPMAL